MSFHHEHQRWLDDSSILCRTHAIPGNSRALDHTAPTAGYATDNSPMWNPHTGAAIVNNAVHERNPIDWAATPLKYSNYNNESMPMRHLSDNRNGNTISSTDLCAGYSWPSPSPSTLQSNASNIEEVLFKAIVIKNIPYALKKENLASIMRRIHLPEPYAFDYHFTDGVFRGVAFANFRSAEDAKVVVDTMNGLRVHNRKIKVEYKKMLPEAERERNERQRQERRGQLLQQHQLPMQHQLSQSFCAELQGLPGHAAPHPTIGGVDLNDPQTLQVYTNMVIFKHDNLRRVLVFPPSIAPEHLRTIYILAQRMGLQYQHQPTSNAKSELFILKGQQSLRAAHLQHQPAFDVSGQQDSRTTGNGSSHILNEQGQRRHRMW